LSFIPSNFLSGGSQCWNFDKFRVKVALGKKARGIISNAAQYRELVRIHPLQKGEMSPHPSFQREESQNSLS